MPGWADETVDCTVRWNRVNRHFKIVDLAGGKLWNQLECGFNQSAFRFRPTRCIIYYNDLRTAMKGTGPTFEQVLCEFNPGEKMQSTFQC